MNTPPLLEIFETDALTRGIPHDEIPELWRQHCERAAEDNVDPGGRRWRAFLDAVCRDLKERRALSQADQERAERVLRARRLEKQAKAARDAIYARDAVSLSDWLAQLRAADADPTREGLYPHETALARAPSPPPGEPFELWLLRVLDGTKAARVNDCPADHEGQACGFPVRHWLSEGKVYRGGRCSEHLGRREA